MKGKRPTTEGKIRILREVAGGRSIREVCQERNLSEATPHRWRKRFGLTEVSAGRRRDDPLRRAGQPVAERLRGKLPRAVPGRMSQPRAAAHADGGPGGHRGLPPRIRPATPPQPAGLPAPGTSRAQRPSLPGCGRAPPSLHRGGTGQHTANDLSQRLELSSPPEQSGRAGQLESGKLRGAGRNSDSCRVRFLRPGGPAEGSPGREPGVGSERLFSPVRGGRGSFAPAGTLEVEDATPGLTL
jgi:hypothetical protein